jgi:hypothetical protein
MALSILITLILNIILASVIKTSVPDYFVGRKWLIYLIIIPPFAGIFLIILFLVNLVIGLDKELRNYFKKY